MGIKTIFENSPSSGHDSEMQVYANDKGELYITIYSHDNPYSENFICLDKETAIKFSKVVRREISFLSDGER